MSAWCCGRVWVASLHVVAATALLPPSGCRASGPPRPPGTPPPVNAAVPDDVALYVDHATESDVRVVARCRGSETFWTATRGDWEYTWAVVRCDVVAVERGHWADPTLTFVCVDAWPTPESGLLVCKAPWPYRASAVLAFDLDTRQRPALVVGQVLREPAPAESQGDQRVSGRHRRYRGTNAAGALP
jgi:hypothetical protein